MTNAQKDAEIAKRIKQLNDLRGELVVLRSERSTGIKQVCNAAGFYSNHQDNTCLPYYRSYGGPWPSSKAIDSCEQSIRQLKTQAKAILEELKGLGVDEELFKLNGD